MGETSVVSASTRTRAGFGPPSVNCRRGEVVTPQEWCHLLAADETSGSIVVFILLFAGPGCLRKPCYVTLGKLQTEVLVPDPVWGHTYIYDSKQTNGRYCGRVEPATIKRLC